MSALPNSPRGDGAAVSGGFGRRSRDGLGPDLTRRWGTALLALLLLGTFASRLAFGLHTVLDGDEATTAFTALRITQGHLVLMEANQHYQGALESYLMAPFVWLLGPTVIAVIVPLALIAALYVVALWDLGRTVFGRRSAGLLLAGVGSVFPSLSSSGRPRPSAATPRPCFSPSSASPWRHASAGDRAAPGFGTGPSSDW